MPEIKLLNNKVFVHNMKNGDRIIGKILLTNDDGKAHGIRPRWAQVYAVGPEVTTLAVGDWVLIAHGRWTRKLMFESVPNPTPIHAIEYPEGVLMKSTIDPEDDMAYGSTDYGKLNRV